MEPQYESWAIAFSSGTDYEADLVRDRLDDAGIPAIVYTKRDHSFNLTIGDLASVHVLVPPDRLAEARELIESPEFTDAEMEQAAMNSDPMDAPAHTDENEAMLDSGIESIRLSPPDEPNRDEAI